ncbi:hypothetical protein F9U64_14360 [Gracilibacillus oryzae]|uniref:Uncharacterized protein n=1 Tax=Gracilibacillus oryzae TaxID=1672701 RepID=A0A7C8L639_9BACI|nr:hypothetical protein [Gracilibacillus oryzae]KAB8130303.1 hypothetical protein F9U64_14360 [Gracilibacillus oryzae]
MDRYKFEPQQSEMIVNAIVEGYRDYIDHRKDRHEKMTISSAFAWTKGNFIENKISEISPALNITYKTAKAGLTWDYLQFIHDDTKKLFLIKNAAYFNENNFSQAVLPNNHSSKTRRTYLHELSKINHRLEFAPEDEDGFSNENNKQLSFFVTEEQILDEVEHFQHTYNEFHILTYKIDSAYQIFEIMHYLPNPENNKAYKVEDLSRYITGSELTDEEREIIAPEQDNGIIDPAAFDIGILEEEEEENN